MHKSEIEIVLHINVNRMIPEAAAATTTTTTTMAN